MTRAAIRIALSAAVALLAVAGSVTYSAVSAEGADRTVETDLWAEGLPAELTDDPAGDLDRGRTDTPLRRMLLPVPETHRLGPEPVPFDDNDGELDARGTVRLMKQQQQGLTVTGRRQFETAVDRMGLQGMVWRTYVRREVGQDVAKVQIVRLKDGKGARTLYALQTGLLKIVELEKGPVVEGHRNVSCFKGAPGGPQEGSDLTVFVCHAYRADTVVSVEFSGHWTLYPSVVAEFVKKQLDHIASPGEYV
ncbi:MULTISPECIES: hypothetical protein [Streptomyces]|uniref:hypothetical protein n=1 Tax=Streptomyces TaxID=1883 RepID=UPI00102E73C5|nr:MULTISPECIES: hypothetical protein [Streptomyces]MYS64833.1 hypothetical protein [Streptomyces sp. SID5473]TAI40795.1 hypothetical protein EWI31_30925 [Streptomyces tsukubensis]